MPYKDPEKRRQARRDSDRRRRQREQASAVDAARLPDGSLPAPPDRDELLELLGIAARNGSITAIRMLLERSEADGHDGDEPERDSFADLDQLAPRRMRRPTAAVDEEPPAC